MTTISPIHPRRPFLGPVAALSVLAGAQVRYDPEADDPDWEPFQDSYLAYRSEGKSYVMAVHGLWGANRDGAIKVDVARRTPGRGLARRIYGGTLSWQWCALAYEPRSGELYLIVAGYPEISPLETTFFKLRGERPIPFPEGARSASPRALDSACQARPEVKQGRPCLEARRVRGIWRLRAAHTVRTRRPSPRPTVAPNHG